MSSHGAHGGQLAAACLQLGNSTAQRLPQQVARRIFPRTFPGWRKYRFMGCASKQPRTSQLAWGTELDMALIEIGIRRGGAVFERTVAP